jgi:ABC-type transport system involved in cytochrome c biogenesis permease subunit
MTHLVSICSISLYLAVTILLFVQLWRPSRAGRTARATTALLLMAVLLHTATMFLIFRDPRMVVLENGADYFLWVSWVLALVCVTGRRWFRYPLLEAFIVPAIVLFMGSSSYLLHQGAQSLLVAEPDAAREGAIVSLMHAVPALVAVVSLVLALVVSGAFLIVERRLKRRSAAVLDTGGLNLQVLDGLNKHLVQLGFVAISLVIVSGGLWAVMQQKEIFVLDTSVVSGLLVWVLLAVILHVRLVLRWSPKRVSKLTVFVTASFFVSVFVVLVLAGRITHARFWTVGG